MGLNLTLSSKSNTKMQQFWPHFHDLQLQNTPFCCVTLVDEVGSVPADRGAKMLVTAQGLAAGTVGGGKIEARALKEAAQMLRAGESSRFARWNLQTDLGMTCGGVASLFFECFNLSSWNIAVFGAGHVAQNLIRVLAPLPCALSCFDTRADWLDKLPDAPNLTRVLSDDLPAQVAALPDASFVVLMTMGHSTDLPILREVLKRPFPYVGVIGSKTKGAAMRRTLSQEGYAPEACARFFCPIGLSLGENHPQEIAISVAAQLLARRDCEGALALPSP